MLNWVLQHPPEGRIMVKASRMRFAASLSMSVLEWLDKTIKKIKQTKSLLRAVLAAPKAHGGVPDPWGSCT